MCPCDSCPQRHFDDIMYKNPKPTVDVIIEEENGKILLVKRGVEPYKGKIALPGGHVEFGETVEHAARRELFEETGVEAELIQILGVYSDPEREENFPDCHGISTVFIGKKIDGELKAGDDAREAKFYEMNELSKGDFAFDHWKIIQDYVKWKENGGTYWSSKQI